MAKKHNPQQLDGVFILNKPTGPTSTACLNILKRLGQNKIGHAGTLDPLASGVLVVLLGRATKMADYLTFAQKNYYGTLQIGLNTDTYDSQGKIIETFLIDQISENDIVQDINAWVHLTEQIVPAYSAAKHKGKPLYELARKGEEVPIKIKEITVFSSEIVNVNLPFTSFRVQCSAGTYIRSLAHSLGTRLQCGAILTELVREESSPYPLSQATNLGDVEDNLEALTKAVISMEDALPHWKQHTLSLEFANLVRNGAWLPVSADETNALFGKVSDRLFLLDEEGKALALVEAQMHTANKHSQDEILSWAILRGLW